MILTCPSCETRYFVDDTTIGDSGRSVKCPACAHSWHVHGSGGVEADMPVAAAGGAHEAYRERVRERRKRKSRLAASMAWISAAGVFALALGGVVIARNSIVQFWPEAAHAYKAAGFEVNRFGLDFAAIEATRTFDGTTPILTISGRVVNVSRLAQPGSDIRIGLRDELGHEVAAIVAAIDTDEIAPGAEAAFATRLQDPPVEAFELELSFVERVEGFEPASAGSRVNAAEPASEPGTANQTSAPIDPAE